MYAKLAVNNAKKAFKDYLIYFITLTICVGLFYGFVSLSSPEYQIASSLQYNFSTFSQILTFVTYLVTGILIILVNYVNKYMINRRKKEFAMYILLGTEQSVVAWMFFVEMLLVGMLAIGMGIIVGMLFSQVITALIVVTAGSEITFEWRFYMDTVLKSIGFFGAIFIIIGFLNVRVLRKIKLIDMMNDGKKSEIKLVRSKRFYMIMTIITFVIYGIALWCIKTYMSILHLAMIEVNVKNLILCASLLFIVLGTYGLFYVAGYLLVILKERCTKIKYKQINLVLIGNLLNKINSSSRLMATTTLAFMAAMIIIIQSLVMSEWSLGYLDYRMVFDVQIGSDYTQIVELEDLSDTTYEEVITQLEENPFGLEDYCVLEAYFIKQEDFYRRKKIDFPVLAISLSDYNQLRKMAGYELISLGEDEFAIQINQTIDEKEVEERIIGKTTLEIEGIEQRLKLASEPYYTEGLGEGIYNNYTDLLWIIPDQYVTELTAASINFYANTKEEMSYPSAVQLRADLNAFIEEEFKDVIDKYYTEGWGLPSDTRVKVQERNDIMNMSLVIKILGMYAATVLFMIGLTVLGLQQLTDSIEYKGGFNTLKKLGIEGREIEKVIFKQISIYFGIPIIAALLGVSMFLTGFLQGYSNQLRVYVGKQTFIMSVGISVGLILFVTISYFIATYWTVKRNLNK